MERLREIQSPRGWMMLGAAALPYRKDARLMRRRYPMAYALGAQVERSPDGFRRARLAGVRGQAQALVDGVGVDAAEKFRRRLQFIAANADANDMAVEVARGQLEHLLRFLDSEVAGGVEDPQQ